MNETDYKPIFVSVKPNKKIDLCDLMDDWLPKYKRMYDLNEESKLAEIQIIDPSLNCEENPPSPKFKKVKRSKTLDIRQFYEETVSFYDFEEMSKEEIHINNERTKSPSNNIVEFYLKNDPDTINNENLYVKNHRAGEIDESSNDFASCITAVTPVPKEERSRSNTPYNLRNFGVKEKKISNFGDLKTTLKKEEIPKENKEILQNKKTLKCSKRNVKKKSARVLKFD
jgi:hypothetical protein